MTIADGLSLAQTILLFAGFAFALLEYHRHHREQQFQNYVGHMTLFLDHGKLLLEHPELRGIYDYSPHDLRQDRFDALEQTQKARVLYCGDLLGLMETV